MKATVRYDSRRDEWSFGDQLRRSNGGYSIVIKFDDLEAATAADLSRALKQAQDYTETESVLIELAPDDVYRPKDSLVDGVSFELLANGQLGVRVSAGAEGEIEDPQEFVETIVELIEPTLARHRAYLMNVELDDDDSISFTSYSLVFACSVRGKSLADLYAIGDGLRSLLEAADSGAVTRHTVVDLIVGGRAELLLGLPEGPWLDVKSQHYDLTSPHGQISLAEAVARFCNAEEGGVVVVGMNTKRRPGGEVIKSIAPVKLDGSVVRRYRQVIEQRIFPFPTDLAVHTYETAPGEGLVVVSVSPQEEELKPFLVHGAIVGDRIQGAYISIVRRSGEDSIPITAQQIHSTLAAGRALLRRGELPR